MTTFILLLGLTFLVLLSIAAVCHLGKGWLYGAIVANLFFVSVFGAKLVAVDGFVSNIGNIFYAGVFFATYLLIERYGMAAAWEGVWVGASAIVLFLGCSLFVGFLPSVPSNVSVDLSLGALFMVVPRIAVASMFAYLLAQHINLWLYASFMSLSLPLRVGVATLVAQGVDSMFFFYAAFAGVLPPQLLWETIWTGYVVKVAVGALSIPLIVACVRLTGVDIMRTYFPERYSFNKRLY